jgi:hypothetical protein
VDAAKGVYQMSQSGSRDGVVVAHTAGSATEAMVIRGLLESAGIHSPGFDSSEPFPLNEPAAGTHGSEIYVLESQVKEAQKLIAEYIKGNESSSSQDAE